LATLESIPFAKLKGRKEEKSAGEAMPCMSSLPILKHDSDQVKRYPTQSPVRINKSSYIVMSWISQIFDDVKETLVEDGLLCYFEL